MTNRSQFDRRTMASDIRYLSLLERRCNTSRRRMENVKVEYVFSRIQFATCLVGVVASWVLFVSEIAK